MYHNSNSITAQCSVSSDPSLCLKDKKYISIVSDNSFPPATSPDWMATTDVLNFLQEHYMKAKAFEG